MKKFSFILIALLFASCEQGAPVSDQKSFSYEKDTTIWYADQLVLGKDSIDLDLNHLLYKYSDSTVTDWYFKNDTLRSRTDPRGGFLIWASANDSIVFGIRAYVPYFMDNPEEADASYKLINDNVALLDHVFQVDDQNNTKQLDSSIVIIKRFSVYKRISDNLIEHFREDPETIITM